MLKLAIVALVCARALALPPAPDTALAPPDLEKTTGSKCCVCKKRKSRRRTSSPTVCKKAAMPKSSDASAERRGLLDTELTKESCRTTCGRVNNYGYSGTKVHRSCFEDTHLSLRLPSCDSRMAPTSRETATIKLWIKRWKRRMELHDLAMRMNTNGLGTAISLHNAAAHDERLTDD